MRAVVADASPINYLVLIDRVELLERLYGRIVIPTVVANELTAAGAPRRVADWIRSRPGWVEVRPAPKGDLAPVDLDESGLDEGEAAAIRLALLAPDSLLLIDEAAGRSAAARLGVAYTGTLGVLVAGSQEGLIDFRSSLMSLRRTNFRISNALFEALLVGDAGRRD